MSLIEIARVTGVSKATVSRVLNGRAGVSPELAQRVHESAKQLGYQLPPMHRRQGRRSHETRGIRTGTIGLLLCGVDRSLLSHTVIASTISAVESAVARKGLQLVLHQLGGSASATPSTFISRQYLDGLLLLGPQHPPPGVREVVNTMPAAWVLIAPGPRMTGQDVVNTDSPLGGAMAAEYLLGRGLEHMAFLNADAAHPAYIARGQEFSRIATEAGKAPRMLVTPKEKILRPWSVGEGTRLVDELADQLVALTPRPQGLFVPSDDQLVLVYHALERRGVRPERDMALIGVGNQAYDIGLLDPRPASLDLQLDLIAERALEQVRRRLANPDEPGGTRILIPPLLVPPPVLFPIGQ